MLTFVFLFTSGRIQLALSCFPAAEAPPSDAVAHVVVHAMNDEAWVVELHDCRGCSC